MLTDLFRRLALHGWWPWATGVAALLLGLTCIVHGSLPVPSRPASRPVTTQPRMALLPRPWLVRKGAADAEFENPGFQDFTDIYRVGRPTNNQFYVFTGQQMADTEGSIGCVDAIDGKWRWKRKAVADGRYTCIDVGETTLLEITGWPQENTLAMRRLSDGAVLGRPWKVGRVWLAAISGRRVAAVGEGPAAPLLGQDESLYERPAVSIYDEWGHLLRSLRVKGPEKVTGFRHGFALVCRDRTLILTDTGRVVSILR